MSISPIVNRDLAFQIKEALKYYPFVSITGPRQSGKTTLAHLITSDYRYVNLEMEKNKKFAVLDPEGFLKEYNHKVILDEVQTVPSLFPYLMDHTDKFKKNGSYILSGSQNFLLMKEITQSLAGRVAVFSLLPLSLKEILPYVKAKELDWVHLCLKGFYPRLFGKKMNVSNFYRSYIKTFVEKDIKRLIKIHHTMAFNQFVKLCAGRAGNIINLQEMAGKIGIDNTTASGWLSILEASYIVYLLPGYATNYDKRILKKPKLYFYDTGILCHLLGIKSKRDLVDNHLYGAIFENFVINEMVKNETNQGKEPEFSFWRESNGLEIDLLRKSASHLSIYEIKAGLTPHMDYLKNVLKFKSFAEESGEQIKPHLIYGGSDNYTIKGVKLVPWTELGKP